MSGWCDVELQGLCSKWFVQALQCPLLKTWDYGAGKLRSLEASSFSVENSLYHLFQFKYKRNMTDLPKHLHIGSWLYMCVFIQTYRGQGLTSSVVLNHSPPCVWRQSLAEPGTHQLDWVSSPVSSRDAPASNIQQWDYSSCDHAQPLSECWDLNSGTRVCTIRTLLTEPTLPLLPQSQDISNDPMALFPKWFYRSLISAKGP